MKFEMTPLLSALAYVVIPMHGRWETFHALVPQRVVGLRILEHLSDHAR